MKFDNWMDELGITEDDLKCKTGSIDTKKICDIKKEKKLSEVFNIKRVNDVIPNEPRHMDITFGSMIMFFIKLPFAIAIAMLILFSCASAIISLFV